MEFLESAKYSIKRTKLKVAVSVNNRPNDIINIIEFWYSLTPESKFYLSYKCYNIS